MGRAVSSTKGENVKQNEVSEQCTARRLPEFIEKWKTILSENHILGIVHCCQ
jgi:hypothetical protein